MLIERREYTANIYGLRLGKLVVSIVVRCVRCDAFFLASTSPRLQHLHHIEHNGPRRTQRYRFAREKKSQLGKGIFTPKAPVFGNFRRRNPIPTFCGTGTRIGIVFNEHLKVTT